MNVTSEMFKEKKRVTIERNLSLLLEVVGIFEVFELATT
jgi:hypothetical protein